MSEKNLEELEALIENIENFAKKHGQFATSAAIFHGAFHSTLWNSNITLTFIHPSKKVVDITPQWILLAYQSIVN
tara:strand:+ start:993 stop:1217 length:225 start_codon:yes stop_codon:yes gene_type:complete